MDTSLNDTSLSIVSKFPSMDMSTNGLGHSLGATAAITPSSTLLSLPLDNTCSNSDSYDTFPLTLTLKSVSHKRRSISKTTSMEMTLKNLQEENDQDDDQTDEASGLMGQNQVGDEEKDEEKADLLSSRDLSRSD